MPVAAQVHPFRYSTGVCLPLLLLAWLPGAQAAEPQPGLHPRRPGSLRVVSYNIEKGSAAAAIAAELRALDLDVALLQEVDRGTRRAEHQDQATQIGEALGLHSFFAPSYADDGGATGCAILSRLPLAGRAVLEMPKSRNLGSRATVRWRGQQIQLFCVHLAATYRASVAHLLESAALRLTEARHLGTLLDALPKASNVILGGDLNAPPGSEPVQVFADRLVSDGSLGLTYPAVVPILRIDHLFATKTLCLEQVQIAPQGTSDHRPLVADYGLPPDPEQAPAGPQGLRVLTWNIQYGRDEGADPNGWPQRKAALAAELKAAQAQILCLQEALAGQLDFLKRQLPDLDFFAQGRDDGESAGEHCAICYDRALFERADAGTFWLSDHPERPGLAWGERHMRICSWVELIHRATGRRFRVMNTHLPLNGAARLKATRLIVERIETLHQLPTLLMGDFNEAAGPASLPELGRCGMSDTLPAARVGQDTATYRWNGLRVARLDWVLASPEWRITGHRTLDRDIEKIYPSDHCGVWVTLNLPEATKGETPRKK